MNRRLRKFATWRVDKLARYAGPLTGLLLIIKTSGCASKHPSPVLIDHPVGAVSGRVWDDNLRLKLVTYNIWGLPSWMTGARPGRYPKIASELERLAPDFILLQEAWTADARKSAPTNGLWSIARAAGQHTFFQQSGLLTLSRFPIIGGKFYPFSRAAFPDRFVNKGVLKVTVQLPDQRVLNIWNLHLQDGGSPSIRQSQIRELVSAVQAAEDGQIADLVGGDFNTTPDSPLYQELSRSIGPSVQQLSGVAPFVTWDGLSDKPGSGQTLDYIFVRSRVPFQTVEASPRVAFQAANFEQRLSDHLGLEAVVNLTVGPSLAKATITPLQKPQLRAAVVRQVYAGGE
jgi:endonuclease/exonuclease/phosphatase family metal-dependent hydrolase